MMSGSSSATFPAEIKFIASIPSSQSRLGDLGFADEDRNWIKMANVMEPESCREFGLSLFELARCFNHYIIQEKFGTSFEPYVLLPDGWSWEDVDKETLDKLFSLIT